MSCHVCGKSKEDLGLECLLRCGRCKSDAYLLCGVTCQRMDWTRHKRQCHPAAAEASQKKPPTSPTSTPGPSSNDDSLEVSDFFNSLSMMRGRPECKKHVNGKVFPLTEEDYAQIAYHHPHITFMGAFGVSDFLWGCQVIPQTFQAPDGKAFTVRQLAEAFAKAEAHNKDARHCYFERFLRLEKPHSFVAHFGSEMERLMRGITHEKK